MISAIIRKPFVSKIDRKLCIHTAITTISQLFPDKEIEFSILICSDSEIRDLNYKYRYIDRPTDVLSFGSEEIIPETGTIYLGDVVISFETAFRQAESAGHPISTEVLILLIHGILHLSGYDHETENNKRKMWNKQFEMHRILGISVNQLSGEND